MTLHHQWHDKLAHFLEKTTNKFKLEKERGTLIDSLGPSWLFKDASLLKNSQSGPASTDTASYVLTLDNQQRWQMLTNFLST